MTKEDWMKGYGFSPEKLKEVREEILHSAEDEFYSALYNDPQGLVPPVVRSPYVSKGS